MHIPDPPLVLELPDVLMLKHLPPVYRSQGRAKNIALESARPTGGNAFCSA